MHCDEDVESDYSASDEPSGCLRCACKDKNKGNTVHAYLVKTNAWFRSTKDGASLRIMMQITKADLLHS